MDDKKNPAEIAARDDAVLQKMIADLTKLTEGMDIRQIDGATVELPPRVSVDVESMPKPTTGYRFVVEQRDKDGYMVSGRIEPIPGSGQ